MLMLRLYLNIGILYEDNRDFQKAYDYFVKWHETCLEVSVDCANSEIIRQQSMICPFFKNWLISFSWCFSFIL